MTILSVEIKLKLIVSRMNLIINKYVLEILSIL